MTGDREAEALPCPFCDADQPDWLMLPGHKTAAMACSICKARGPIVSFEMKHESIDLATAPAIAAWNTRAALSTTEASAASSDVEKF